MELVLDISLYILDSLHRQYSLYNWWHHILDILDQKYMSSYMEHSLYTLDSLNMNLFYRFHILLVIW